METRKGIAPALSTNWSDVYWDVGNREVAILLSRDAHVRLIRAFCLSGIEGTEDAPTVGGKKRQYDKMSVILFALNKH